jgi:hypothetical protein
MNEDMSFVTAGNYGASNYGVSVSRTRLPMWTKTEQCHYTGAIHHEIFSTDSCIRITDGHDGLRAGGPGLERLLRHRARSR